VRLLVDFFPNRLASAGEELIGHRKLAGRDPSERSLFMISLLSALWVFWGSITVALAGLLIYRSLVAMKEEDQLFLDPAELHFEREQRDILTQLRKLTPPIRTLSVVSAALLALIAGIWIYRGVLGVAYSTLQP
jgi:hypothetical protein